MSSYVVIELQTSLQTSYDVPSNAVAGETMTIAVTPMSRGMTGNLTLVDGRVLPMTMMRRMIAVALPQDAPEGQGTVALQDEVGNSQTWNVAISGQMATTPDVFVSIPATGMPTPIETHRWPKTTGRVRSAWRTTGGPTRRLSSSATLRSRYRVARIGHLEDLLLRGSVTRPSGPSDAVRSHTEFRSHVTTSERWTVTKRPEGPDEEFAIVTLLL